MKTLHDIDINALYKKHLQAAHFQEIPPEQWDERATHAHWDQGKLTYTDPLLEFIAVRPNETVLDIGCGPGTLAIPLAEQCQEVFALDFSPKMLEQLTQAAQTNGLPNITTFLKGWDDCWDNVPKADVVLASRSTLVPDLDAMIAKLHGHCLDRVVVTATTDAHFFDDAIFKAIGREDDPGFPTYLYLVNRLHQMGIQCEIHFIENPPMSFTGPVEKLVDMVRFSLGHLTKAEEKALVAFYNEYQATKTPIRQGQRAWAVLTWRAPQSE